MPKVQFIFAIHNHQPVGNFDFVAEDAYQKAYLPFLNVLERHPRIKLVLHYTGILYRFFEEKHPEFIGVLKRLAAEGRVEVLSGGFYEPVLAILPDEDKVGQVKALSDYVRRKLGYLPKGMWLAERVWEPHLPKFIAEAGIDHVVVDDFHFKVAGLRDDELDGYYLTEEQDGLVKVFPGSERLRYLIPFHPPEETIELLSGLRSTERRRLAVMADDGEKFGVWPETHKTVYEEGWLERFFTLLEQNSEWLETTTFSEFIGQEPPRGRIFLPTASYMEMGEWALPTRAMTEYNDALAVVKGLPEGGKIRPFIKGGIWRNFLAKYPESNHMHKRMLMASRKVHDVLNGPAAGGSEKTGRAAMLDHLYQSQCNDSYWHGVFGGLYLPHLRSAVYEHLIKAEYMADAVRHQRGVRSQESGVRSKKAVPSWIEIEQGDFDRDGSDEVMVNSDLLNLFLDPAEGGRITEFDWKPRAFNLTNTLTRRREGYHEKILHAARDTAPGAQAGEVKTIHDRVAMKEEGLEYHLQYDWYKRGSLLDHFLGTGVDLVSFMRSEYYEAGDFVLGGYRVSAGKKKTGVLIALERAGTVEGLPVVVRKDVSAQASGPGFTVRYRITNRSNEELNTSFGSEFNFSLLAGNAPDRYYRIPGHTLEKKNLASSGETNNVSEAGLVDEWLKLAVTLSFSQPAILWRAPVETVSQSEAGFERVYQSSMVMPLWRISLGPGKSWDTEITVRIE
jgi:alpha-amylase